ncbi:hypothetical protein WICPIJ_000889 [Wickerhamomyces pijperi]|uniref:Uncharacterized protein n=1 Tax=Wickerhamomyces pijperi TaxID=599730 RepID=A0A9P8QBX6_WICPI|nr:hypothetical protein WICPIJ_000889 [Wickerhamomyces pijperi]
MKIPLSSNLESHAKSTKFFSMILPLSSTTCPALLNCVYLGLVKASAYVRTWILSPRCWYQVIQYFSSALWYLCSSLDFWEILSSLKKVYIVTSESWIPPFITDTILSLCLLTGSCAEDADEDDEEEVDFKVF